MVGCASSFHIERLSKAVGPFGKVIIVEPDPQNIKRHRTAIADRKLANVSLFPQAAFNRSGQAKFLVAPNSKDHRLVIAGIEHDNDYIAEDYYLEEIDMEVDTIDNIMRQADVTRLDHIEIMVNGAELHVLQGMEDTLAIAQRLFIKSHARYIDSKDILRPQIQALLEKRGFCTKCTRPSRTSALIVDWQRREGDLYAWKRNV